MAQEHPEHKEAIREYGFIVFSFNPEHYYWDLVIMVRKLAQAAFITLLRPRGIVIQAMLAIMISIIALCAQIHYKPYRGDGVLDRAMLS